MISGDDPRSIAARQSAIRNPKSEIELHAFVIRPAAAFGRDPVDDLIRIGDVARLAVDTVREVHL